MTFRVAATSPRATYTFGYEREALDPIGAEIVAVFAEDEESYAQQIADADAVIAGLKVRLTAEVIGKLRQCKIIQTTGIGFDRIDVEAATAAGARAILVPTERTRPEEVAAAPEVADSLEGAIERVLGKNGVR